MYYVEQKYFDSGKTSAKILTEEQAQEKGYFDGFNAQTKSCDIWVDWCETMRDAQQIVKDTLNA